MKRATDNTPRVAICYTRVSSGKQLAGVSLDAQAAKFAEWCALHDIAFDPANVLSDRGISGKNVEDRPAVQEAVDRVCSAGASGVLWCFSLSRFGRSACEALAMANRIKQAGAALVLFSDSCDTSTATGRLLFTILAGVAEMEREHIASNTANALQHLKSIGRRVTRLPPYGFAWSKCGEKHDGKPVYTTAADLGEQTILLVIRAMHEHHPEMPLLQMSRELADLCLYGRSGNPFCASTLSLLLRRKEAVK